MKEQKVDTLSEQIEQFSQKLKEAQAKAIEGLAACDNNNEDAAIAALDRVLDASKELDNLLRAIITKFAARAPQN